MHQNRYSIALVLIDHFRCARSAAAVYNIWARCLWHVKDLFLVKVHVLKIYARRLWSLDLPVFKSTGVNKGKAFQWIHQLTPSQCAITINLGRGLLSSSNRMNLQNYLSEAISPRTRNAMIHQKRFRWIAHYEEKILKHLENVFVH